MGELGKISEVKSSDRDGIVTAVALVVDGVKEFGDFVADHVRHALVCEVLHVTTGAEALQHPRVTEVSLAISDVLLPDMTGLELAHQLQQVSRAMKVVLMSFDREWAELCRDHGVSFVAKSDAGNADVWKPFS